MEHAREAYHKREGHCDVPRIHKEDGENLGTWVNTQRRAVKKESVSDVRVRRLEELGFEWNTLDAQWERNFARLEAYHKREGHCDVPQSHKEDGENHGLWVSNQRMAFKKGKLDPKRAQRLEGLGMKWRIK